jgi:hypothetical protein
MSGSSITKVATLIVVALPIIVKLPVIVKSPLTVPPEVDSLVFEDAKAPLAYDPALVALVFAVLAVSKAALACGLAYPSTDPDATVLAKVYAALA